MSSTNPQEHKLLSTGLVNDNADARKIEACKVLDLPERETIPFHQKYVILSNDVAYLTHVIHKYPSKFIPHIPRWAIRKYLRDQMFRSILDPMCGSGTTLVEGVLSGHHVFGIDIDPLARLITKVKITPLDEERLRSACRKVMDRITHASQGKFLPSIPTLSHWFNEGVTKELSIIRDAIEEHRDDKDIYDFLIVTFSSIIRRVSNADNQSQKTYVSHTNPKSPPAANPIFTQNLQKYAERIIEFSKKRPLGASYHILEDADARTVDKVFREKHLGNVDLAVSSPPYIKAVDYIYTHMAEYFWIGDLFGLANQKSQNIFKTKYIGTKMVYADEYSQLKLTGIPSIDPIIERIYPKNKKFAYITFKFFEDMRANLKSMYSVLQNDAHYVIVVGDCNVAGENIRVRDILIDISEIEGYTLENLFYYEIRNRYMRFPRLGRGGLITHDWVIDLKKR